MDPTDRTTEGAAPAAPPPPTPPPVRRLTRSRTNRMIGGVAGGLAEYFGVDPVLVRIAFVLLVFAGASGVLVYLIAWLVVPVAPEGDEQPVARSSHGGRNATSLLALVLLGLGVLVLLGQLGGSSQRTLTALVLVGAGALLLASERRGGPGTPDPAELDGGDATWTAGTPNPAPHATTATTEAPRARGRVARVTFGLLLVLAGAAVLVEMLSPSAVTLDGFLAVALVVTGGGLVAGAWTTGSRRLIGMGIVLTLAASAASAIDVSLGGGVGERLRRPATIAEIEPSYRLGVGSLKIDLTEVDLPSRPVDVDAQVGVGELVVIVPIDASVSVRARADAGEVNLFGRRADGLDVDEARTIEGRSGGGRIVLDLRVGVGEVEVRHG